MLGKINHSIWDKHMKHSLWLGLLIVLQGFQVNASEIKPPYTFQINSKLSLVHLAEVSVGWYDEGSKAVKLLLDAIDKKDPAQANNALKILNKLSQKGNYGGEYTALTWFCKTFTMPESRRREFVKNSFDKAYYHFFTDNQYSVLKEYIERRFRLKKFVNEDFEKGLKRTLFLSDLFTYNNPAREEWEQTNKIMGLMKSICQKGYKVADIGCGTGYYTTRLSRLVGDGGKVYAIDISQEPLDFLATFNKNASIKNIVTIKSQKNDISLKENVDIAFMSSVYHLIYVCYTEKERNQFINSILRSLKKNGTLIVMDNSPIAGANPYSTYIAQELIIAQLKSYGFHYQTKHEVIPQRYVLIFKR
jgi:ubiquinone/menaquinone biosynthesis C-methylase UbiE